jgi:hypothetical protein
VTDDSNGFFSRNFPPLTCDDPAKRLGNARKIALSTRITPNQKNEEYFAMKPGFTSWADTKFLERPFLRQVAQIAVGRPAQPIRPFNREPPLCPLVWSVQPQSAAD